MKTLYSAALRPLSFALLAVLATSTVSCRADDALPKAAAPKAAAHAPLDFDQTGQTWAFLGDSITHSGSYHQYVQLFLSTRYPGRDFWTLNAGRSGDTAVGTLRAKRVAFDLKEAAPDVVFVHFGMNDVGSLSYTGQGKPGKEGKKKRLETYTKSMEGVVEEIRGLGAKVVIVSPTIYDNTSARQKFLKDVRVGLNDELGRYGQFGRELAQENGFPFVNVHTPMTQLTAERQKKDADFTLTRDRVHPNSAGDQVFAFQILRQLDVQPLVYRVEIDAVQNRISAQNATVVEHQSAPKQVTFVLSESALPFPILENEGGFKSLVPFSRELNQQLVRVSGLAEGKYQLSIDGQPVAQTDANELAQGLDLSDNQKTPQYRAALQIRDLIFPEKMELQRAVRDLSVMMLNIGPDKYNWEADDATMLWELETWYQAKPDKGGWAAYLYQSNKKAIPRRQEIRAKLAEIRRQLAAAPREAKHSYEIVPLAP